MLKQATVEDISNSRVTKRHGRVVVTTRYYPRFLKKKLVDEYYGGLAPTKELLSEFRTREEVVLDHDQAFADVDYESKFSIDESALAKLQELSDLSRAQDVYLICHCKLGQRCHRDILLMIAKQQFDAPIGRVYLEYPVITKRLLDPTTSGILR
ncbi:MAG: DUF488 family protein [Proteobacteria bacterium]|nr:MAG: DUF488 family protein [Pseudomonadota bacterium]